MFNDDGDFKKLLPVAPTILSDMKEEFRAKFEIVVKESKLFVLKNSHEKEEEVRLIQKCLTDETTASNNACLVKLEVFNHQKKEVGKFINSS